MALGLRVADRDKVFGADAGPRASAFAGSA
jgi:hypothetical protein